MARTHCDTPLIFNCGDWCCTQTTLYIFFIEIILEKKKMILQLFGLNFSFEIAQKHWTQTLKQSLLWWNHGKPFLSIAKKVIVWWLIMLVAKDNANPKWLLVMENVAIKDSVTKNVMIEKLIKNVTTKMWQLKDGKQKCGDWKLATKNMTIESCGDWNMWLLKHVVTKIYRNWILWQLKTCDDQNVWRPNSYNNWNFNDQIPGATERCFNRHKIYNDRIGSNFCHSQTYPEQLKSAFDLNWLKLTLH